MSLPVVDSITYGGADSITVVLSNCTPGDTYSLGIDSRGLIGQVNETAVSSSLTLTLSSFIHINLGDGLPVNGDPILVHVFRYTDGQFFDGYRLIWGTPGLAPEIVNPSWSYDGGSYFGVTFDSTFGVSYGLYVTGVVYADQAYATGTGGRMTISVDYNAAMNPLMSLGEGAMAALGVGAHREWYAVEGFITNVPFNPRPANDDFAEAQLLTGESGSVQGTNVNATLESPDPIYDLQGYGENTVWYKIETTAAISRIHLSTAAGETGDPIGDSALGLYSGTDLNDLVELAYDDDNGPGYYSDLSAVVPAGTYWITVTGFSDGYVGSFTLNYEVASSVALASNSALWAAEGLHSSIDESVTTSNLYRVNPATAECTLVGPIGYTVACMAYDTSSNTMYGITTWNSSQSPRSIIKINLSSGKGTVIAQLSTSLYHSYTQDFAIVFFLGQMIGFNGDYIYTIDKATGIYDYFGDNYYGETSGGSTSIGGMALVIKDGYLYVWHSSDEITRSSPDWTSPLGGTKIYDYTHINTDLPVVAASVSPSGVVYDVEYEDAGLPLLGVLSTVDDDPDLGGDGNGSDTTVVGVLTLDGVPIPAIDALEWAPPPPIYVSLNNLTVRNGG